MTTWLITGCSTGLGRALALAVLSRGDNAVVTARDISSLHSLAAAYPESALAAELDVTDRAAASEVLRRADAVFGDVDVLVNNAGYGYRAAVEEGEDAEIERLFATNVHGAAAMIRSVLPQMRARRHGAIVNVSSMGARLCSPGSGYYSATKAALSALSASLRKEVAPLGITVTVVEAGAMRTDFAGRSMIQSADPIADYAPTAGRRRKENDTTHGNQPGDPARAAAAIVTAVTSPAPPALLLLGSDAIDVFARTAEMERDEVEKWRTISAATSYASADTDQPG